MTLLLIQFAEAGSDSAGALDESCIVRAAVARTSTGLGSGCHTAFRVTRAALLVRGAS
jgi:hypothetical protein